MRPTALQQKKLYAFLHAIVRRRDGPRCRKCGRTDTLQLSHIYPKGRYRLMEFLSDNVKLLCHACHLYWWHRNPIEAHEWLQTVLSPDRLKRLKLASQTYLGPFDPKLSILGLEHELASYETGSSALGGAKQKVSTASKVLQKG